MELTTTASVLLQEFPYTGYQAMNERLRILLAEMLNLPPGEVTADMRRVDTDSWDSLNHLRLITAIESEFGTVFTMDEITELQTPGDLQRIIDSRSRPQPGA